MDEAYFAELVRPAPEFSPEQLEQLRQILGGPIDELGTVPAAVAARRAA
jgi:hypothetical protein